MFPPKTIGIIGNLGKMATNVVVPLFEGAHYKVIGSDIKNPRGLTNADVVQIADVVYFSILPISTVAPAIEQLIPFAKPDTLWLHGTSIQNPVKAPITPVLLRRSLAKKRVDVGFLHFMVGPTVRSLRGQSVVYGFPRRLKTPSWEEWLINLLRPTKAHILKCSPDYHDELTTGSQVIPQLIALVSSHLWLQRQIPLSDVLRMAGPPCWFQNYGIIRNLSQPDIVANILGNHPGTHGVIRSAVRILNSIARVCGKKGNTLAKFTAKGLKALPEEELDRINKFTDWHIRLEGDMRGGAVCFYFPRKSNRLGLLVKVLQRFDREGLDKTSCMVQTLPNGGCQFYIGVKAPLDDPRIEAACEKIVKELNGKRVAI